LESLDYVYIHTRADIESSVIYYKHTIGAKLLCKACGIQYTWNQKHSAYNNSEFLCPPRVQRLSD